MPPTNSDIDVLAIGEILIDFISTERADSLRQAATFRRHQGGSPANIAVNVSKLGGRSAIMAKTGAGAFGQFLQAELQRHDVNTDYLVMEAGAHTSLVFVSQTSGTPDFEPYRNADYKLTPAEIPTEAISRAKIIHTSTWPLSQEPSRAAVFKAFRLAQQQGKIVSFDPNYTPRIWPDYREAQQVMRDIFRYVTLTKASLDDAHRFFGPNRQPHQYIKMFHELGPETVVFTMGQQGSLISEHGHILGHLPARPIQVVDATGAGDAFWSGFLIALLDDQPLERCLLFAREVVELKLQTVGTLPAAINRAELYARLPEVSAAFRPWPAE